MAQSKKSKAPSTTLYTRDGVLVKEIGSWEREQLLVDTMPVYNPIPRKNNKDKERQHIYRVEALLGPYWVVKITRQGSHFKSKKFHDRDHGGKLGAQKEAAKYRDLAVLELRA